MAKKYRKSRHHKPPFFVFFADGVPHGAHAKEKAKMHMLTSEELTLQAKARNYVEFIEQNGKAPNKNSADKHECSLGNWFYHVREKFEAGLLTHMEIEILRELKLIR
jgi:hypothetical protein